MFKHLLNNLISIAFALFLRYLFLGNLLKFMYLFPFPLFWLIELEIVEYSILQ